MSKKKNPAKQLLTKLQDKEYVKYMIDEMQKKPDFKYLAQHLKILAKK